MNLSRSGFTLIELMITLAIVAIIASIAYPSYSHYLMRAHRLQAQQSLYIISKDINEYLQEHHTLDNIELISILSKEQINEQYYTFTLTTEANTQYKITATPRKQNTLCGTLGLNQFGEKFNVKGELLQCWLH
jgi:type IV pilus assembly protein PilE